MSKTPRFDYKHKNKEQNNNSTREMKEWKLSTKYN